MTPALPDILTGVFLTLATPLPPESSGDYMAGRLGLLAMIAALAAQEAERGLAARVWENGAIAAITGETTASDLAWSALDAENARLRRRLIGVHEAAEASGDTALERRILELYAAMAKARRLDMPGG